MMPVVIAQNINAVSTGSLTAVLKRTMDKAPTIPSDRERLELIVLIISDVTIPSSIIHNANDLEYTTPLNVFLYTYIINNPKINAVSKDNDISTTLILPVNSLSTLFLIISVNPILITPLF